MVQDVRRGESEAAHQQCEGPQPLFWCLSFSRGPPTGVCVCVGVRGTEIVYRSGVDVRRLSDQAQQIACGEAAVHRVRTES